MAHKDALAHLPDRTLSERVGSRFNRFFHTESSSGIVLVVCTVVAMVWANSPYAQQYFDLWHTKVTLGWGDWKFSKDIHHLINDGLMAVFFFFVGLELKRELLVGQLSNLRQSLFPIMGAIGGIVVPALIFVAFNSGTPEIRGWGIPMATDIAFALGVLALCGRGIPLGIKVFLAALAIVDDLAAVLVIAIFYTEELNLMALGIGLLIFGLALLANFIGIRKSLIYLVLGGLVWFAFLKSGVHATIAGVLMAVAIPQARRLDLREFIKAMKRKIGLLEDVDDSLGRYVAEEQQTVINEMEAATLQAQSPLQRLEEMLHTPVGFVVMPIFALANAGIALSADSISGLTGHLPLGIILGLFVGKQLGVFAFAWLSVKGKLCELPRGANWLQVYGVCALTGIGFTMSIFIANLALPDPASLNMAKLGILVASLLSGILGFTLLKLSARTRNSKQAEASA